MQRNHPSAGHHVTLLVWPCAHPGLRRHGEHTRFVAAVQLTSAYSLPSTHSAAHVWQRDQPVPLAYVPSAHAVHDVLRVVRFERVPIGHCVHSTEPFTDEKLPGPHAKQALAPDTLAYVPAGHCTQALSPVTPA